MKSSVSPISARMKRRKIGTLKLKINPVKLICMIITVSFVIVQIFTMLHLRNIPQSKIPSPNTKSPTKTLSKGAKIGGFGEMVIGMLPEDLAFTLFLPSEEAIRRDLRLNRNDSDAYAVLTRVLGFSSVPRRISSADLGGGKQERYDSISGLGLYVGKDAKGKVVVNGLVSEEVDLRIGGITVHVMDGVVMDSDFEQSMRPDDEEDDEVD